jgi:hypothetical protein
MRGAEPGVIGDLTLRVLQPPTANELEATRERWREAQLQLTAAAASQPPFLVITPLGMPLRGAIEELLAAEGVAPATRRPVANWATASTLIYARTADDERLRVALAFEQLWRSIALSLGAERWDLKSADDHRRVVGLKKSIHQRLGMVRVRVELPGVTLRTPDRSAHLRAVHVPDAECIDREARILNSLDIA